MKLLMLLIIFFLGACSNVKPNDPSKINLFKQAEDSYKRGMLTEAEASYLKLTKLSPGVTDAWTKLGNIYVRTGQLDAAVTMYDKCLEVDPKETRCWNNLALTRIKQSMETLKKGLSQVEPNSDEYYRLDGLYNSLAAIIMVKGQ